MNCVVNQRLNLSERNCLNLCERYRNIDGDIMNTILARLLEMDIVGLPVHDSVIVKNEHYDCLYQVMKEEYKEVMGYEPMLK